MNFPITRMRRLRKNNNLRRMVRETTLSVDDLVMPLFVCPGQNMKNEIKAMPDNFHMSVDKLVEECKALADLAVPAVILFGIPEKKDAMGTESYSENGIIQKAIRAIKKEVKDILVISDVCLCEYTNHGHCGVVEGAEVLNDPTLELLAKQALSHAEAGADIVAPSDMMDGRVAAIREILDKKKFYDLPILSYSAKYSSAFYGPFREAAGSSPAFGDRSSYQMDIANSDEAIREVELDIAEGADIVMIKPALSYLDIIQRVKSQFGIPVAAYNVSGEYSCIKAAAANGWIDENRAMMEVLFSIKRAGADIILTYFAKKAAEALK